MKALTSEPYPSGSSGRLTSCQSATKRQTGVSAYLWKVWCALSLALGTAGGPFSQAALAAGADDPATESASFQLADGLQSTSSLRKGTA
jgi:hypothetical protein